MSKRQLNTYCLSMALGLAAAASVGCQTRRAKLSMPERQEDTLLASYIQDFQRLGTERGVAIDAATLDRLRVVEFVDDIAAKKESYGQPVIKGDDLAGTCTDAEVDDTMGTARLHWVLGTHKWSEVWVARNMGSDSPEQKILLRELMFHELGHCLLGLDHASTKDHRIMSPALSNDPAWVKTHWHDLVDQLFGRRNAPAGEGATELTEPTLSD